MSLQVSQANPESDRLLIHDGVVVAVDNAFMRAFYYQLTSGFSGHVVLLGFGFGIVPRLLQYNSNVESIECIELVPDVPRVVEWDESKYPKTTIKYGNAFEWKPDRETHFVFHDIGAMLTKENFDLEENNILRLSFEPQVHIQVGFLLEYRGHFG